MNTVAGNRTGGRTVSYTCSYVPEEIILAAGLVPKRAIPEARPSEADAYMHPNTCYYVKSLLASGLAEAGAGADCIVFANSCDAMRRLNDVWREYVEAVPAFFIDVPKKRDPASIEFFASELRRFADNLEETFPGARVTDQSLGEAIGVCNRVRLLMDQVFGFLGDADSGISGLSVLELCLEGARSHPAAFAERLEKFLSNSKGGKASNGGPRIVLTANVIHRPDLITLVEDLGGHVVALDSCIGARHYETLVNADSKDPMLALAERTLGKASCARMEGMEERFQRLKKLASDTGANGVIYSTLKSCDMYLYEEPLMRMNCEDAGLSFLFLENDYEWTGLEQMKTRVEAFLAMIGERGAI